MLKRVLFWDFQRASWQYDIIVGLILAFIFLTPREWFNDQPRIPSASAITLLPSEKGTELFFVDPQLLADLPEGQRAGKLTEELQRRTRNRRLHVVRVEPIVNSEGELQGYHALARQ
jgi:hypothetical protein